MVPASTLRRKLATISGTASTTNNTTPTTRKPPENNVDIQPPLYVDTNRASYSTDTVQQFLAESTSSINTRCPFRTRAPSSRSVDRSCASTCTICPSSSTEI